MITTITGENSFGWQTALNSIVDHYVRTYGEFVIERLDGEEAPYQRLHAALTSLPFLSEKKLVVLRAPSANKEFVENAEGLLAEVPETTEVIIVEPKLDKRSTYFKFLKKSTNFQDYPALEPSELSTWLTGRAKELGGSLSASDARFLIERVGATQERLANELEKLLLYKPHITRTSIELLTDPTPQSSIFQLLEAAFAKRAARTLELYEEQRALRVEPQQIIAMLAWQLHIVALLKTAGQRTPEEIAKTAKISPYVIRKSQTIARDISLGEVKVLIDTLTEIDVASKTKTYDLDAALQQYLLQLTS